METLEIIIGLIFIYLLLSLLGTTLQELWAGFTSLRGKVLLKGVVKLLEIENMAEGDSARRQQLIKTFEEKVKQSRVYQKYSSKFLWFTKLPSYLSAEQVTSVVQELLGDDQTVAETHFDRSASGQMQTVSEMPNMLAHMRQDDLRQQLLLLHRSDSSRPITFTRAASGEVVMPDIETDTTKIEQAKATFKKHYDEIMNRATGWYKRSVQGNLLIIGLLIALAFDADTFKIYNNLTHHSKDRQQILELASNFVAGNTTLQTPVAEAPTTANTDQVQQLTVLRDSLYTILTQEIQQIPSPLGLGWQQSPQAQIAAADNTVFFLLFKLGGWLVTALAISMGAPFWFDMLQKVINIRNAGVRPQDAERR
ncbi:MAG TPA: hypothetical protein PKD70_06935 [Saprospiraceae bacterium]|nr:hypothetical protein [Saprospiraceae bacterium]